MTDFQRDTLKCLKEFEKFYDLLMRNAPTGYVPWLFLLKKMGKDPATRGSWKDESARLTKEQAIGYIRQGFNLGISARREDPLVLIDIDNKDFLDQTPKDTLVVTSRKRCGIHAFGWDKDHSAKVNIPTDNGEVRAVDQYLVACGSYVPFDMDSEKDKKAFDALPEYARQDSDFGYYTVKIELPPRPMTFDDLPDFFKQKAREDYENTARVKQTEERKEYSGTGKYTELFKLKASDVVGWPSRTRSGHPLHDSDTDANFSINHEGTIATCWRHMVSLNAVQLLCIKAGYANCEDAGTPHMGRGYSKIKGDKNALEAAYNQAVKDKLIPEYIAPQKKSKVNLDDLYDIEYYKTGEKEGEEKSRKLNYPKVADYLLEHGNFLTMRDNDEIYHYEDGVYKKDEKKVYEEAKELLGQALTTHAKAEMLLHFKIASYFEREKLDSNINLFCLENGVFDVEKMELLPHSPDHLLSVKVPVTYDKDADCPAIKKFLSEVLDPDDILIVQELFGYCLYKRYRFHKGFMFMGSGSNGKTTTINLIERFLGEENCSGEALQSLENNRFASAVLFGKLANMNPDLPSTAMKQTSVFKSATGEDMMTGENKFGQRFTFTNYAKMIFATNKPPEIIDDIDAVWRRWIPLNFTRTFSDKLANTNLINELSTPEELSGLFNWAIEGLKRLLANNGFSFSKSWEEVRDWYVRLSSPEKSYIEKCIGADPTGFIPKEEIYGKFLQFCKDNKLTTKSDKVFFQRLKECYPGMSSSRITLPDGTRKNCWTGIAYIIEEKEENDKNDVKDVKDVNQKSLLYPLLPTSPFLEQRCQKSDKIEENGVETKEGKKHDNPDTVDINNKSIVEHEYVAKKDLTTTKESVKEGQEDDAHESKTRE